MEKEQLCYLLEQYTNDRAAWQEVEEMLDCIRLSESEEILQECIEAAWKIKAREMPFHKRHGTACESKWLQDYPYRIMLPNSFGLPQTLCFARRRMYHNQVLRQRKILAQIGTGYA